MGPHGASQGAQENDPEEVPTGRLRFTVQGPDGQPVREAEVKLSLADPIRSSEEDAAPSPQTQRTDDAGTVVFEWPAGVSDFLLEAPGIGFVKTAYVEIPVDATADVPTPRLVPFARVSGRLAEGLDAGADLQIRFSQTYSTLLVVDAPDGTFDVSLPGGAYSISAHRDETEIASIATLPVWPGDEIDGLVLKAPQERATAEKPTTRPQGPAKRPHITVGLRAGSNGVAARSQVLKSNQPVLVRLGNGSDRQIGGCAGSPGPDDEAQPEPPASARGSGALGAPPRWCASDGARSLQLRGSPGARLGAISGRPGLGRPHANHVRGAGPLAFRLRVSRSARAEPSAGYTQVCRTRRRRRHFAATGSPLAAV